MARMVFCEVDQVETEGLDFAPWPGDAGKRVFASVGKPAWQRWGTAPGRPGSGWRRPCGADWSASVPRCGMRMC